MTTKSNKCSSFSTLREPSVKRKDLHALTLVRPTRNNPVLDPLAVLHLNNWLFIILIQNNFFLGFCWSAAEEKTRFRRLDSQRRSRRRNWKYWLEINYLDRKKYSYRQWLPIFLDAKLNLFFTAKEIECVIHSNWLHLLCILTSFRVCTAHESWLKYTTSIQVHMFAFKRKEEVCQNVSQENHYTRTFTSWFLDKSDKLKVLSVN